MRYLKYGLYLLAVFVSLPFIVLIVAGVTIQDFIVLVYRWIEQKIKE